MAEPAVTDSSAFAQPATLDAWLTTLEARAGAAQIQLGLERVAAVLSRLSVPRPPVVITVGGTNGKGSACAMLEAILKAAGYRVGCYTSPHLVRYNERVRVDGEMASDAQLVAAFNQVEAARKGVPLTYFEHGTLAAWWLFGQSALDAVILEVGLGGRLDAVNVIDADCAIVTSVAIDHVDFLGATREAIGFEKAGIFRPGCPAICGDPQPPATLIEHAETIGAQLWISGRDFGFGGDRQQWGYWRYTGPSRAGALLRRGGLAYPALRGANQLLNASAVLTALEALRERLPVSMQAVRQGLMLVEIPGRFQVLPGRPTIVLDVAHNPQAAGVLAENLSNMGFYPETHVVIGMLADKDVAAVLKLLKPRADHWYFATLPGPRGLPAHELQRMWQEISGETSGKCFDSPAAALRAAREQADEGDRIVALGSFLVVADLLNEIAAERK